MRTALRYTLISLGTTAGTILVSSVAASPVSAQSDIQNHTRTDVIVRQNTIATTSQTVSQTPPISNIRTKSMQSRLNAELRLHAALATPTFKAELQDSPTAPGLKKAVDNNSQQIANTVEQLYPGTHDQFLSLWRSHIADYEQYLTGSAANNSSLKDQAKQNLTTFVGQTVDLLSAANSHVNSSALKQNLAQHGDQTLSIIDNLIAGNKPEVRRLSREGVQHMSMVAASMVPSEQ